MNLQHFVYPNMQNTNAFLWKSELRRKLVQVLGTVVYYNID